MLVLDPRTMYLAMATVSLVLAVGLTLANVRSAHMRAMTIWVFACLAMFGALSLLALRGSVAPELSVVTAFALLFAAIALDFAALTEFAGRRVPWVAVAFAFAACVAVHTASYFVDPGGARLRAVLTSLPFAAWLVGCALALVVRAKPHERETRWLTAAFFLVWAVFTVGRGLYAVFPNVPPMTALSVDAAHSVWLAVNFVAILGSSLGFILMTKERSDHEVVRIASTDPLTGLPNRRTFDAAALTELKRAAREGRRLSLLEMDLDHFKLVNDTYGHPAGDAVLQDFARVLRDALRPFDLCARYGGEEFCALLIGTGIDRALAIAERVRELASKREVRFGNDVIRYTVSVGAAGVPASAAALDASLAAVDDALYRAKDGGRNRVAAAEPEKVPGYPADKVRS
jgi:diguanylate cyclase (GGDEF)-like protein